MASRDERAWLAAEKPGLVLHAEETLNAEAPPPLLDPDITPVSAFFVRNNGRLPAPNPASRSWTLTIDGEVDRPLVLSLDDLRRRFETVEETAVLECAGNGRARFSPPTPGLPWRDGAVGCARWTGVRLADVLAEARPRPAAVYTGHYSPDPCVNGVPGGAISRGIPIGKAVAPETLLAFGMNGRPLPFLHGGPLRVVVPGYPGSAWQKWIDRITLRDREHDGPRMTGIHYRLPRRPAGAGQEGEPEAYDVITAMPVRSLVTAPAEGFSVPAGALKVTGHAWSGTAPVTGVRVSSDGGRTWHEARLGIPAGRFAWVRFAASVPVAPGPVEILAQARDADGAVQPAEAPWNPGGYCNNAIMAVRGEAL